MSVLASYDSSVDFKMHSMRSEKPIIRAPPSLSEVPPTLLLKQLQCFEDVLLVEVMCLGSTRMPGESYRRQLGSLLLYLCDVFRALINSLVC